jgi:FKBP-type peptidyl-prolyl cis-trans isomerase
MDTQQSRYVIGALALLVAVIGGTWWYSYQGETSSQTGAAAGAVQTSDTGLVTTIVKEGTGEGVIAGQTVAVHYTGTLDNGTVFDSSIPRGEPFVFTVGTGQVIKGWDEGVQGMKMGEVRKLTIPPGLGYGDRDLGRIPPNSTLHFEIELLGVVDVKG